MIKTREQMSVMGSPRFLARCHIDGWLLLGILSLIAIGCLTLYSAKQNMHMVQQQGLRFGIAFIAMMSVAQIPPQFLQRLAPLLYGVGFILLGLILFFGEISKGGQRWLNLGFLRFQPAEILKIAVPLMVAHYLSAQTLPPRWPAIGVSLLLTFAPCYLVAKQPDLGTAILIGCSGLLVLFLSGLQAKRIFTFIVIGLSSLPLLWLTLYDYQKQRVITFFDPEADPLGKGYQILQSKIAIGSGGVFGKGWLKGTQSQLDFLPERATDVIFAVFSEEFGLLGAIILLGLYFFLFARGMIISIQASDSFTRLMAGTFSTALMVYVFVNIGMVTGLLPAVGVPLPLISYGGSAIVTLMISFGILMSIATHQRLLPY